MSAFGAAKQVCLEYTVVLLVAGICFSQPTVSLSPTSGPPTSKLLVSGSGFRPNAAIRIYFDTQREAKATADGTGSFSKVAISVPASALPGQHLVSAIQHPRRTRGQAPFLVNTNWSQFHFTPNHKGLNPYENVLNPKTVGNMELLWSFTTGGAVQSAPAVVNGVVYVGSNDGAIYALKASTGAGLWSFPVGFGGPGTSPAVANGVVYVGALYALNARTGAVIWSDGIGGASATLADGVIYLGSVDEDFAVNARDGSPVWQTHLGYATASSMAFANGLVYFGTTNGVLYALNASDASDRICEPRQPGWGYSSPAVVSGVVYVGSSYGVAAVNAINNCEVLWSYTIGGPVRYSSPAVADGAVYVGSDGGNIYALNASTGALLWSYTTGGLVASSPAVANGVVYVGSNDGRVYALNAASGALLWSYITGGAVQSSPAIANGVLYVGSNDNKVYAFGLRLPGTK